LKSPDCELTLDACRGRSALHSAAYGDHIEVADYLIDMSWDMNATDRRGVTPLMLCCWKNNMKTMRKLIEKHADVNIQAKDGATCLIIAGKEICSVSCALIRANVSVSLFHHCMFQPPLATANWWHSSYKTTPM
jgi:hypothetical protein